jgi:pantoate--beta-alanine ligase
MLFSCEAELGSVHRRTETRRERRPSTPADQSGVFFMEIISDPRKITAASPAWRQQGLKIALVPTMGFFHEGHLSLMRYGREQSDRLVVSLFVNPTQFGPTEDLARYPRDLERDAALAREAGVDVLYTPTAADMYPEGYQTYVSVEGLSQGLCGASRPGHFRGVATVVLKLFNQVLPHLAVFGEKDYQQLAVIKRMVADLNVPVQVVGRPIVREADGLAMSSRNTYLTPEERGAALCLIEALSQARKLAAAGEADAERILGEVKASIAAAPHTRLDYAVLVDPDTLQEVDIIRGSARLAVAARVGNTRLIDNMLIEVH